MQDLWNAVGGQTSIVQQMQECSVWFTNSDKEYLGALIDAAEMLGDHQSVFFDV